MKRLDGKLLLLLGVVLTAHCKQSAVPAPAADVANAPSAAAAPDNPHPQFGLASLLADEAKHRPTGTVPVEAVLSAMEKAGIRLQESTQHPGSVWKAAFCKGAKTQEGVSLSICEYADEQAAKSGMEASRKAFATPGRSVYVNRKTTLTVLSNGRAQATEQAKQLARLFSDLSAS
jgi:hypothetical protein